MKHYEAKLRHQIKGIPWSAGVKFDFPRNFYHNDMSLVNWDRQGQGQNEAKLRHQIKGIPWSAGVKFDFPRNFYHNDMSLVNWDRQVR